MCGIFGWALGAANRQNAETLARLTNSMAHRGPDGAGYTFSTPPMDAFRSGSAIAACRSSTSAAATSRWRARTAATPSSSTARSTTISSCARSCLPLGHRFRTSSDTEVLIEAYRAWDLEAIRRFRGMFAFALWDAKTQRLLLARDPFGKKPLFLADAPGRARFSVRRSSHSFSSPASTAAFNSEALGHYLLNRYVPGPATFFRAVTKLQPGHYAVWQARQPYDHPLLHASFRHHLRPTSFPSTRPFGCSTRPSTRPCAFRMRSDAPFGAYLSGGIDSSARGRDHGAAQLRARCGPSRLASAKRNIQSSIMRESSPSISAPIIRNWWSSPHAFMDRLADCRRFAAARRQRSLRYPDLHAFEAGLGKREDGADRRRLRRAYGGYPKHRAEPWVSLYQRLMPEVLHEQLSVRSSARSLWHAPGEGPCLGGRRARPR